MVNVIALNSNFFSFFAHIRNFLQLVHAYLVHFRICCNACAHHQSSCSQANLIHPFLAVRCTTHTGYFMRVIFNVEFVIVRQLKEKHFFFSISWRIDRMNLMILLLFYLFTTIDSPFGKYDDPELTVNFYDFGDTIWVTWMIYISC